MELSYGSPSLYVSLYGVRDPFETQPKAHFLSFSIGRKIDRPPDDPAAQFPLFSHHRNRPGLEMTGAGQPLFGKSKALAVSPLCILRQLDLIHGKYHCPINGYIIPD